MTFVTCGKLFYRVNLNQDKKTKGWVKFMDINVTRTNNGILLETLYNKSYYHKMYSGYSRREARKLFSDFVLKEESKYYWDSQAIGNTCQESFSRY